MVQDLRDGFVPGSFVQFRALAALLVGALLVLVAARLLARRTPAVAAGAGAVLLLVAVLRSLSDAAEVLSPPEPGLRVLLLGVLLLLGLGLGTAAGRGRSRAPAAAAAVVLAQLALLAPFEVAGTIDFGEPPPRWLGDARIALTGALAAGALAALRPSTSTALLAALALPVTYAAYPLLDSAEVHAVAAGAVLAVLLPLVLRALPEGAAPAGVLLGVVLVLAAVAADDALRDAQQPTRGDAVGLVLPTDEEVSELRARLLRDLDPAPLVPGLEPLAHRLPGVPG